MREIIWLVVAALVGAFAMYMLDSDEPIIYPEVIVPAARIIEREPDTIRTFVDRFVYVEAPPIQVARAIGGAREFVEDFCTPVVVSDTVEVRDTIFVFRSVQYDRKWAWRKDRVLLTGPTNVGDLMAVDYDVRGDWSAVSRGNRPLVEYPRSSLLYDIWEGSSQIVTLGLGLHFLYEVVK